MEPPEGPKNSIYMHDLKQNRIVYKNNVGIGLILMFITQNYQESKKE